MLMVRFQRFLITLGIPDFAVNCDWHRNVHNFLTHEISFSPINFTAIIWANGKRFSSSYQEFESLSVAKVPLKSNPLYTFCGANLER